MKLRKPWQLELVKWAAPMPYEEWVTIAQGDMVGKEIELRRYYAAEWEPNDCHEFLVINKRLRAKKVPKPPRVAKSRLVTLSAADINRRYAVCLWRETMTLTTRRMTPEARQIVNDTRKRIEVQLEIPPLP